MGSRIPAKTGGGLAKDVEDGMTPDITIEYKGYPGCEWGHECLPTGSAITTYVTGFVKSAEAALKEYPGQQIIFEPINESYGYGTAAQYANIVSKLLPEAEKAGIPLSDIYVAAYGKRWVPKMYEAQSKLETEVQGWYFHPYGPAKGTAEENSEGIQSLPNVQAEMTSGQNNIIVSEVGYWTPDVNGGESKGGPSSAWAENSNQAASWLTEMLDNALPYHEAGWLRSLITYSRNDGGWAMQVSGGALTKQGEALDTFADSYGLGWWSIQPTPNPTEYSTLDGVSCASDTSCIAVGNTANTSGVTLAEKWNGTTWSAQSTPNPTGEVSFIELKDVSCPSTSSCMAVGSYNGSHGTVSLAEYWNGSTWTIKTTPSLTGDYALTKVSCTSASTCTAIGYQVGSGPQKPVIERWNGETETWSAQTVPVPAEAEAEASVLKGVSCTSSTYCIAVGDYRYEESDIPLVETWSSEKWAIGTAPSVWGWLADISCTTSTACTAVGSEDAGTVIAERWNGSAWSNEPVPVPKGEHGYESLSGVSCVSASRCTTTGGYAPAIGELRPFTANWNGKFWSLATIPSPTGTFTDLEGLSCTELTACTTVGSSTPSASRSATLAERFAG